MLVLPLFVLAWGEKEVRSCGEGRGGEGPTQKLRGGEGPTQGPTQVHTRPPWVVALSQGPSETSGKLGSCFGGWGGAGRGAKDAHTPPPRTRA